VSAGVTTFNLAAPWHGDRADTVEPRRPPLDQAREAMATETSLRLTVYQGDRALAQVVRSLDAAGVEVAALRMARPTLDDVFLTLTGRSLREAAA